MLRDSWKLCHEIHYSEIDYKMGSMRFINKAFREWQHPSDQWMDSPFMGQQAGNCNSFTSTHYFSQCIYHALWPKGKPIMRPTLYPTHISFIPSQSTFPFLQYGYQKFDLENPRLRSRVRSKFKVTTWVQHSINSYPFGSMSIHPLIPMIELFFKFDLQNPRSEP